MINKQILDYQRCLLNIIPFYFIKLTNLSLQLNKKTENCLRSFSLHSLRSYDEVRIPEN